MINSYFQPDVIIINANVITMDNSLPRAQAIAIKDGKILAMGKTSDINHIRGSNTKVLDCSQKTILPGFIDAHAHVLSAGTRHVTEVDCSSASIGEISKLLFSKAKVTPDGCWLLGFKFDDTKIVENRFLTHQDLDLISTRHPIVIAHQAGHVFFFNSAGLSMTGYNNESPDPHGGRLGRDPVTGDLNGQIFGTAMDATRKNILPCPSEHDQRKGLDLITRMFLKRGVTSVHDAMVSNQDLRIYQESKNAGDLGLRIYMLMHKDHFPALRDSGIKTGFGDNELRLGGIKLVADGAIATRTAYLSDPYIGSCDHGVQNMYPDEIQAQVLDIHRAGFQVCIHSNGDATIDMVLKAYEKAQSSFPRADVRHRLEHCSLINPDLLARMAALGCVVTPFSSYIYYHGEKMGFYGPERLEWMFAQRSFIDNKINSTGASDYPCSPPDPLIGIQSCVLREDTAGRVWGPSQRITVEEALRLYTINGAYASFDEQIKGSIEPGKLADIVILDKDPTNVDTHLIQDISIEMTIVGGKIVYEN